MKHLKNLLFYSLSFGSLMACSLQPADLKPKSDPSNLNAQSVLETKIATGAWHTCITRDNGILNCWGDNREGQTGGTDKTATDMVTVKLEAEHKVADIAAGINHTCALLDDGKVKCWGNNSKGQAGGANQQAEGMVDLETNSKATHIAARGNHTCALLDDGKVKCWGDNREGQTGGTDKTATGVVTVNLDTDKQVESIAMGRIHTCVLLEGGEVKCWGSNSVGQTGGTDKKATGVMTVNLGGTPRVLAAGGFHNCALLDEGTLKCWGSNIFGQTGGTDKRATGMATVDLKTDSTVTTISAGQFYTCVLLEDSTMKCWGYNVFGQTGGTDKTTTGMVTVNLETDSTVTAISASEHHTCVLLEDSTVKCWGTNVFGQTGGTDKIATGIVDIHF